MQEKKRSPPMSICLPNAMTPKKKKKIYSPSFLPLSGTALGRLGDAAVDGGEAGFSESMVARRLRTVSIDPVTSRG